MVLVQVQVQQATHLKDTRLVQALHLKDTCLVQALTLLRDGPLNPESADHHHLGLRHQRATECDPRKCHHRSNQQLRDNSEDSKQIN